MTNSANILDSLLIEWIKTKHTEIDRELGVRLTAKGFHRDMITNKAIELIFRTKDTKRGNAKILSYYVKRMDNSEIKLLEVQISEKQIIVV